MTQLPRVMTLRDVVLFNITAIAGLRWLTTAGRVGPAGLVLWVIAMVIFFLPSAMAVRELADIDPGEGGIYRWATRAFGPRHGFLAGWGYWVNNLVYYPSLLLTSGAIVAYVGGPGFVHLAENKWFIAAFSLGNLWIAVGLNLVGLRVGKWVQNLGAYGTWLPAAIFVLLFFSSRRRHTRFDCDWSSDVCSSDLSIIAHKCHGRHKWHNRDDHGQRFHRDFRGTVEQR